MSDASALSTASLPGGAAVALDAVVSHHLDGHRSGVARFNELLAERLGVPMLGLFDPRVESCACPLLSFKVAELAPAEAESLAALLARSRWSGELFLHDFRDLPLERELVTRARRVHCGNLEILERVRALTEAVEPAWTPGLVLDDRVFRPAEITVFSFGMAHKIRTDMFRKLKALLEASGRSYALYVSAANHETASLRDAELVFEEMHALFPETLYFLGNLSDVAVFNQLRQATFFAAFFTSGVRANNTSVASALERGAVVLTNLDRHSPREFVHMENVVDIERCDALPTDPLVLKRLSLRAMETGRARGWDALVERLRDVG
jgi:hypothetical protein